MTGFETLLQQDAEREFPYPNPNDYYGAPEDNTEE